MRHLTTKNSLFPYLDSFESIFKDNEIWHSWVENEKGFSLTIDVPGMNKEDIKMEIKNKELYINASRTTLTKYGEKTQKYSGSYSIPENLDETKIEANLEKGVLTLFAPKLENVSKTILIK